MTNEAIVARNRANARRSTGPRSASGKAVVAGNARRHGATGAPDPEDVAAWLSIILDQPDGIGFEDDRYIPALKLAKAEAQVSMIE